MKPRIYDRDMNFVGILQNAASVSYTHKHNDLYTASFKLPYNDPKTALCDTHYIVDIFDGDESKGKYRILDEPEAEITGEGQFVEYSCEHVIATLLNDVIDGYMEIGGEGVATSAVISDILSRQTVKRWKLGVCDFDYEFQYSWENTNLMDALFSIPTCFEDNYHWTYDTSSYPWTINLVRQSANRSCEIRRKRNMQQIKREKDASSLCTRLYCKGNGEGVNQVGISEVNDGLPYIDADTISIYGVLCSHYIDLQVTEPETLLAKGKAMLEEMKHPRYTYKAKAVDLSKVTGLDWYSFDEGKYVHLIDDEKNIDLDAIIIEVKKSDIDGNPLDMEITISNKSSDVSSAIEDLSKRTAITAQYSQGATNLYAQQFADNADEDHPAIMRVYIPSECKKINKVMLSWQQSKFRAYSKGTASGGGGTATTEQTVFSRSGIGKTGFISESQVTSLALSGVTLPSDGTNLKHAHSYYHNHDIVGITIPALNVPISSHSHGINYGIYEASKTERTIKILVDDAEIPADVLTGSEVDIVEYLSTDNDGKIKRGTWHEIQIVPDGIIRIEANLFVQTFVTSYSGGNY